MSDNKVVKITKYQETEDLSFLLAGFSLINLGVLGYSLHPYWTGKRGDTWVNDDSLWNCPDNSDCKEPTWGGITSLLLGVLYLGWYFYRS